MAITGVLSEFSLPEIFQFLEQGHKTGRLTIQTLPGLPTQKGVVHYIWFHLGRIVAGGDRLDNQGLFQMIQQRGWMSDRVISKIPLMCSSKTPLGLCLKSQGVLQAEQLKMLFYGQVIRQVCALFRLTDGLFNFEVQADLPMAEMTGLSLPATEVTLTGLRALRDWTALTDKLPAPDSGLVSLITGQPPVRMDSQEWQLWEFVNGNLPLAEIARQIGQPLEKVQQVAFRLIVINLAEEVPMVQLQAPSEAEPSPEPTPDLSDKSGLSQSFLQSLVGFLRNKV